MRRDMCPKTKRSSRVYTLSRFEDSRHVTLMLPNRSTSRLESKLANKKYPIMMLRCLRGSHELAHPHSWQSKKFNAQLPIFFSCHHIDVLHVHASAAGERREVPAIVRQTSIKKEICKQQTEAGCEILHTCFVAQQFVLRYISLCWGLL